MQNSDARTIIWDPLRFRCCSCRRKLSGLESPRTRACQGSVSLERFVLVIGVCQQMYSLHVRRYTLHVTRYSGVHGSAQIASHRCRRTDLLVPLARSPAKVWKRTARFLYEIRKQPVRRLTHIIRGVRKFPGGFTTPPV